MLAFKVGDEVIDQDGAPCRVVTVDSEDREKPYELEYPSGDKYWAAEPSITRAERTVRLLVSFAIESAGGTALLQTTTPIKPMKVGDPENVRQVPRASLSMHLVGCFVCSMQNAGNYRTCCRPSLQNTRLQTLLKFGR